MADTITIPSPRVFLTGSPIESHSPPKPAPTKPKQPRKRNPPAPKTKHSWVDKAGEATTHGVEKKKQSKSRNGCVTCKAKRLKCDETKPTCQQCARRNVDCGGYRKDYKWRPFGETTFVTTSRPSPVKLSKAIAVDIVHDVHSDHSASPPEAAEAAVAAGSAGSATEGAGATAIKQERKAAEESSTAGKARAKSKSLNMTGDIDLSAEMFEFDEALSKMSAPEDAKPAPQPVSIAPSMSNANASDALYPLAMRMMPGMLNFDDPLGMDSSMYFGTNHSTPLMTPMSLADHKFFPDDEDIEEVVRDGLSEMEQGSWTMTLPDFYPSSLSAISQGSTFSMSDLLSVPRGLDMDVNSPEMLTVRFDQQTCGILSMKDGPTENPWRTLIWPLARDSPALYHAIASMTSFHTCNLQPVYRLQGIDHMRTSIEALATGIENMRFDTAIATTLALAFAESWDQHTSTGINHIKGAKILVNQALTRHSQVPFIGDQLERLKFLTNAWVYMDVLARLTSEDDDESNDFDAAYSKLANPFGDETNLDPLMGAASTLFPIIGRVANLVRRVRRTDRNSPSTISHAMELKKMLQEWDPPILDESIEDPSVDIEHSIQTAEAYRWATILYLHQAVPEIPSESSAELGKKIMVLLATVPLSSRTVIVHIYPLIAASCEALDEEDRQWATERWQAMAQRMKIGVIDRCVEVVQEVWIRRDEYELIPNRKMQGLKRGSSYDIDMNGGSDFGLNFCWSDAFSRKRRATNDGFDITRTMNANRPRKTSRDGSAGSIDHEFTVRGRLHWLGVMKDWGWEVLLG